MSLSNQDRILEAFRAGALFGENWYVVHGYDDSKALTYAVIDSKYKEWLCSMESEEP